jgi:RecA/RadA recombinase
MAKNVEELQTEEFDTKEMEESVKLNDTKVELSEEADNLFQEFNTYLKKRADIVPDTGDREMIPTSIRVLDTVLGGGFPVGALSMIVGQPGCGKSMLAFQTLGSAQRHYQGKLLGGVLDSEEATSEFRLAQLGVLNPRLRPYGDITVEKVFKFLEGLSLFKEEKGIKDPSVVIWDSIANTLTQKEIEAEDPNSVIGYKARLLSLLVPKYVKKCTSSKICWIAVNQLRDNVQIGNIPQPKEFKFMSQNKKVPGGNIVKFNAFHLLEMKVGKLIEADKYGFDGVEVAVHCVKNKAFVPNITVTLMGSFTSGFSDFWTSYKLLVDTKRLNAAAWNYLVSYPDKKFRTKDAENLYKTDKDFKKAFDATVDEALKTDFIDKYTPEIDES